MLRSIKQLYGDKPGASDGEMGQVKDFYFDDRNRAIRQLVIKTGHRLSGKEVRIPSSKVDRISWNESAVFVNMTKEAILQAPACDGASVGADPKEVR